MNDIHSYSFINYIMDDHIVKYTDGENDVHTKF